MACCYGKRVFAGSAPGINPSRSGISGYVSRLGQAADPATTAPALTGSTFGKMVGAGVTIWGVTKILDRVFFGRGRR